MSRRPSPRAVRGTLAVLAVTAVLQLPQGGTASAALGLHVSGTSLDGATVASDARIQLEARGAATVSWILDGVYRGRDTQAPFELQLATSPGEHRMRARVTTSSGAETTYQARFTASSASAEQAGPAQSDATRRVGDAGELVAALGAARPGQVIQLADGVYSGRFALSVSGTSDRPIVLRGGSGAVLNGGSTSTGTTLHLKGADHWRLEGFSVRGGQKGVVLDGSDHTVLSGLDVGGTGMEAVHFRSSSSDNRLENSTVHHTGLVEPGSGEGVYVGSASSNWGTYGVDGGPDRSDRNVISGNRIHAVAAENIDVKEGTTGGTITGNVLEGAGMTGANFADSWIDVKGNDWLVTSNSGTNALLDGFQTHVAIAGWGQGNVFRGNRLDVDGPGYGINIHQSGAFTSNAVGCDNAVIGAAGGLANVPCR